jgi:type I restriction-modification system DNA methylase subunit
MGTGGFLISSLRHLLQQSKTKEIKMNWDFISNEGLGGREAEHDTYQLAISNMLISSGHIFNVLEKGDSIRNPITNKYDIILANPPFGIDGLIYNEILHPLRNEYMPIKSNSAVPLFLQAIIHMLKVNGRCAVVLPNGKELFSKGNELVAVREYLMKTCDLKEIYYLPPVFTHTTISTCVLNFVKKRECKDVLETNIKISKIQKETGREYTFTKTHQTSKVKFYNYNPENELKHLLNEVSIEEIAKNGYSLNYAEYLNDEKEEEFYEDGIMMKSLGDICNIEQGKSLTKNNMVNGDFNVIGGGKIIGTHNKKNRDGDEITLTRVGDININFMETPYYLTDNGFSIKSKTNSLLIKYLYYLLKNNNELIQKSYRGTAQKVISKTNLKLIKVPIPTIERQQEIVKNIEELNDENTKLQEKIKENINKTRQIMKGIVKTIITDTEPIDKVQNKIVSIEV